MSGTQSGCAEARGAESGFTPNQYVNAYGLTPLRLQSLSGQGERIALIEVDGYRYSDIKTFASCFGLDIPAINTYTVGAHHPLGPGEESTLDLEVVDAVAPDLKAIDVYENAGDAADVTRSVVLPLLSAGAKPQVISASLGLCEPYMELAFSRATLTSIERDVELAAATGITLIVATGDDGSSGCINSRGAIVDRLAVNYPATSPFVTAVGGTNVSLTPTNVISGQTVWNDTPVQLAAAGGGVSELFGRPSYQKPVVHNSRRVIPDVALLADLAPGYEVYCTPTGNPDCTGGPAWHTVGGRAPRRRCSPPARRSSTRTSPVTATSRSDSSTRCSTASANRRRRGPSSATSSPAATTWAAHWRAGLRSAAAARRRASTPPRAGAG